ncbi:MAG: hypothetical protein RL021_1747 [Bacteroidota bacterium]|jgi:hypothetical protein
MTKQPIRSLEELRGRIRQLKSEASEQELQIRSDYDRIKEEFRPENILMNALAKMTGININRSEFFRNGIAVGISLVLKRFIFKTENSFEKKVYSWIDSFFDRIRDVANKFTKSGSVRAEKIEDEG